MQSVILGIIGFTVVLALASAVALVKIVIGGIR